MKICLTGIPTFLGNALQTHLSRRHTLLSWPERATLPVGPENSPRDLDSLTQNLSGVEAVLHTENFEIGTPANHSEEALAFHRATTDTYFLCKAALAASVERILVIGSLNVYESVSPEYLVDEMWRPRPEPEATRILPYLASECVREFVRHGPVKGVCLRFAPIGDDLETQTRLDTALAAVDRALALTFEPSGHRWHVIHVANSPRFLDRESRRILGMPPRQR